MNNYGISENNPIKLKSLDSVVVILNNIVTDSGFYILYHLKDYFIKQESIIVVIEVFSGIEEYYLLYFDITNDCDVWKAPSGFLFFRSWIECKGGDFYHDQDYFLRHVETRENTREYFELRTWRVLTSHLMHNYGVLYKDDYFPVTVYNEYWDYDFGLID
ncbi:MAG: hypothetical protein WCK78_12295 [Paludibacter sp.]